MIKPTVGRVVWFHRFAGATEEPALICKVHDDRLINIGGFDENGNPLTAQHVTLVQESDAVPAEGSYAAWPSYPAQVAKATVMGAPFTPVEELLKAKV